VRSLGDECFIDGDTHPLLVIPQCFEELGEGGLRRGLVLFAVDGDVYHFLSLVASLFIFFFFLWIKKKKSKGLTPLKKL